MLINKNEYYFNLKKNKTLFLKIYELKNDEDYLKLSNKLKKILLENDNLFKLKNSKK